MLVKLIRIADKFNNMNIAYIPQVLCGKVQLLIMFYNEQVEKISKTAVHHSNWEFLFYHGTFVTRVDICVFIRLLTQ